MHRYSEVKTEWGNFRIVCSPRGITTIRPAVETASAFEARYKERFGVRPIKGDIPYSCKLALRRAATGHRIPSVTIDWSGFTDFQKMVLKKLRKVPPGKIYTYSWLARQVGRPKAARAVGNVMAHNPIPFIIPCHRIVPASGGTGNYGLGRKLKRELLKREGIVLE